MDRLVIRNASVLTGGKFARGNMIIEDGIITEPCSASCPPDADIIDAAGRQLVPGVIDIHTHGGVGVDFNHVQAQDVAKAAAFFASQGVTSFLPAVMTDDPDVMCERLAAVAEAKYDRNCTAVRGIHLEGPFLSPAYKGAMPERFLRLPDYELFSRFQKAARGLIRIVTLAPELEGAAELTRRLTAGGVRVSVGHSGASYEETAACIRAGAASTTHTMNGMKLLHMHDPAILTAVLESDIFCEMICDGFHLHPPVIRLLLKTKGADKMIPVTDSIMAAGCPDGSYYLGVNKVKVENGDAKLADTGTRAGSTLTMIRAVRNLLKFTELPRETVFTMVSQNPARLLGIYGNTGSLDAGKQADMVLLSGDTEIDTVFCRGRPVYTRNET